MMSVRNFLLALSLLGTLLFGAAFAVSFLDPLLIERAAREVVRMEVERRVGEKVEALSNARLVVLAQKALGATDEQIAATRRDLAAEVPRKVAEGVANMLKADCECRKHMVEAATRFEEGRLASLVQVRERLAGMVQDAYRSVADSLMREFRIFTGCNALAFALLGVVTGVRRASALQLLLPAAVLVGATAITGAFYLFGQNWLHTLVFSDYVGFGYAAYLGATALMLADVAFNRARVTGHLLNAFPGVSP